MANSFQIESLKQLLLRRVSDFVTDARPPWKREIAETFSLIRNEGWEGVIFGGVIRTVLTRSAYARPRDIDIVLRISDVKEVTEKVRARQFRINSFGGVQLLRGCTYFDLWPVDETWAFRTGKALLPDFATLPTTTFLNIEAVAVDLWPKRGRRRLFTNQDSFFEALLSRTLEINLEENPYPLLCVVRSLSFAQTHGFFLGEHLADYVVWHGLRASVLELEKAQLKHYRTVLWKGELLQKWLTDIQNQIHNKAPKIKVPCFRPKQMTFVDYPQAEGLDSLHWGA